MSAPRVRLSSQTRTGLAAVAATAVVIVSWLAWLWVISSEWAPPRIR